MAQIRRKTIDPTARDYLLYAKEKGFPLSWNSYENMLPQDGFSRMGLSCSSCLLGPCRLNPFARSKEKTICGFTSGDLAYRHMMGLLGAKPDDEGDKTASLLKASRALAYSYAPSGEEAVDIRIGRGVLREDYVNIVLEKFHPLDVSLLVSKAKEYAEYAKSAGAKGFSLSLAGDIQTGMNTVSARGDAEFAILTGLVDAYVTVENVVVLGRGLAGNFHTRFCVLNSQKIDGAEDMFKQAAEAYAKRDAAKIRPDAQLYTVRPSNDIRAQIEKYDTVVFFGGGGNIKLELDDMLVRCVKKFSSEGALCILFSNAAVTLAKYGLYGKNVICCEAPALGLADGNIDLLKGKRTFALYPEIVDGYDLAEALCLGSEGFKVLTATEFPVAGDKEFEAEAGKLVAYIPPDEYLDTCAGYMGVTV